MDGVDKRRRLHVGVDTSEGETKIQSKTHFKQNKRAGITVDKRFIMLVIQD